MNANRFSEPDTTTTTSQPPSTNGKRVARPSRRSERANQHAPSPNGKNDNPEAPTPASAGTGRDPRGKFALGNCGGPGNPFARQVAALRQAALNRFDGEKIGKIFDKLYELALEGDVRAARLILSYTLGKPAPFQHPDGADADEWNRFKENGPMLREAINVVATDPIVPLTMVRVKRDDETYRKFGIYQGALRQTSEQRAKTQPLADRGDVRVLDKWYANSTLAVPDPSTITVANQVGRVSPDPAHAANKPSANGKPPKSESSHG